MNNMKTEQRNHIQGYVDQRWLEYIYGLHDEESLVRCLNEDEKRLKFYRNLYQLQKKMFEGVRI
jgi:hypothetical protein